MDQVVGLIELDSQRGDHASINQHNQGARKRQEEHQSQPDQLLKLIQGSLRLIQEPFEIISLDFNQTGDKVRDGRSNGLETFVNRLERVIFASDFLRSSEG